MEKIRAMNVTADRSEKVLIITWSDGRECRYPFAGLRAVCPCAECQGGHENMGKPADKAVLYGTEDPDLTMKNINAVGSYALGIEWSDGHWQGIYTWQYLYDACSD
ncbi:MAG: DUF971 domain-containing protein [Candidatus Promineifilaceae bacterium]|jgi:DUF971 family protein